MSLSNMQMKTKIIGFSFIELVIVIMVLSIASVGLVSLFGNVNQAYTINYDKQSALSLARECGEWILASRRNNGYSLGSISDCSSLPSLNTKGPASVTLTSLAGGACPTGATCQTADIEAIYNSVNAKISIMLVDY